MIRLVRPLLFCSAGIALALVAACRPAEEGAASSNATPMVQDPSGLTIPMPLSRHDKPATHRVVLCLANGAEPYQYVEATMLVDLMRSAADFELAATDARNSAERQSEQLRSLAASKPAAVIVQPVDAAALKEELGALRNAGVTAIGLDSALREICTAVVFCDQKKIGAMAAGHIIGALQKKASDAGGTEAAGRVVQIQGDEKSPKSRERSEGFIEALKAQPGIVLVHDTPSKGDRADAALRFDEALRLQKSFDVVYAHNDMIALGVSEAAVKAGVRDQLLIVGTDGISGPGGGLEMLGKSQIDATVHQPLLVDFAWKLIEKIVKDAAFKPKSAYEIEPLLFTPRNLEELRAKGIKVPEY